MNWYSHNTITVSETVLPDKSLGRIIPVGLPGFTWERQLWRLDSASALLWAHHHRHHPYPLSIYWLRQPQLGDHIWEEKAFLDICLQFASTTTTQHSNIQPFLFLPWENQSNQFHQLQDETMAASGPLLKPLNIWQILLQGGWFLGSFAHHWSSRSEHLQVSSSEQSFVDGASTTLAWPPVICSAIRWLK